MRPEIPHSHSGDLRSTILAGTLANIPWQPSVDCGKPVSIVEVRKDARRGRRYQLLGLGAFEAGASRIYTVGERYFVKAGEFHSSECLSKLAVTLVERLLCLAVPSRIAIGEDITLDRRRRIALPSTLRTTALTLLRTERDRLQRRDPSMLGPLP